MGSLMYSPAMLSRSSSEKASCFLWIEVVDLHAHVLLELAGVFELALLVLIQRAVPHVVIVVPNEGSVADEKCEAKAHSEGYLVEANEVAHLVPGEVWEETEHPVLRNAWYRCHFRVPHRRRQCRGGAAGNAHRCAKETEHGTKCR